LAQYLGPALVSFGLVKTPLALILSVGPFYLLIKLAGLGDAMTKAKQTPHQPTASQA